MGRLNFLADLFRRNKLVFVFLFISAVAIGGEFFDKINVDNLQLDGNSISTTNTDGNVVVNPNGAGTIELEADTNVTGSLGVTGTVDGRDVSADGAVLDTLNTNLGQITDDEADQIENIDSVTISNQQWSFLGALDQALTTVSDVIFNTLNLTESLILDELNSTPSNPSAGKKKIYCKNDGRCYTLDSNGNEVEVGSGAGGNEINYIENGNAEANTNGWKSYSDGTASPISCGASEGGSALVRDTTNVIRPKASFTTDTVAGDGAGYAYDFTIAEADKGGALVISLESRFLTGTFLGNWSIWICDMEANGGSGELINVFGEFTNGEDERGQDLIPSTEIRKQTFYFFPTDASNYRLLLHNGSEPMGANSELNYDSVSVGPQLTTPGFIGSAREAFTPTGSWTTNTSYSGHRTRVGDHLEGDVIVALSGAPDNTTLTLTVPDGLSIDTSKAPQDTPVGYAFLQDTDNATNNTMATVFVGSTSTVLSLRVVGGTDIGQSTPFSWGSGDTIRIYFKIPIEGWNASAALSTTSAALETVKAFGTGSGSSGTENVTASLTAVTDEWGIIDEANDEIVIPKDGDYLLIVRAVSGSTAWASATATFAIKAIKNGSTEISLGAKRAGAAATFVMNIESSRVISDLKKGDKLELAHSATAATTASYEFEIVRVPDFNTFSVFGESKYLAATSAQKTHPASNNVWLQMTGNKVTLTRGSWVIHGVVEVRYTSTYPQPSDVYSKWATNNGTDTITEPTVITVDAGLASQRLLRLNTTYQDADQVVAPIRVTVAENTDLYLVPRIISTTPANVRVNTHIYAEKLQ